ncbi:acetate/propionate family kinase [Luteimonas huabeiensis]|uniref:acetate/propionate family kinase n=1 Tax=Luteimonas huabeiensis TaxID=1244513 RepID=UPI000464A0D4|nr:acetate/propionate family kinase [Luteimonas huabeiensis]
MSVRPPAAADAPDTLRNRTFDELADAAVSAAPAPPADRYPTEGELILVLNCGSSSIKFALFDAGRDPLPRAPVWNGKVQGIGGPSPTFGETGVAPAPVALDAARPHHAALARIRERVLARLGGRRLHSVAHRVVHGGSRYFAPVRVDAGVLADLKSYVPLAPLHQPFALEAMEILLRERPALPQVACFDTAFHHTRPQVEQLLPLPYAAWERGLRRYGFHGLSYEYMAAALPERHGEALARGRTIVAHLGSGASLCAMRELQSVATTMGFSALDGLMMGTRTGALDPGAVLYLMEIEKLSLEQVARVLYHESGLLGVSGISADPRELLAREAGAPRAALALQLYVRRIVRELGALAAVLGGLDLLVFTAGIGEHSAVLRERVCAQLGWLGVALDAAANAADAPTISAAGSRVRVGVEPTNEEWIAAGHARGLA